MSMHKDKGMKKGNGYGKGSSHKKGMKKGSYGTGDKSGGRGSTGKQR